MCYDISFSMAIESVLDYIPDLVIDPQLSIDCISSFHIQAQANLKVGVIIPTAKGNYYTPMTWGMDVFGRRVWNAQSEKILDPKSSWYKRRNKRCLIPVPGIYEHRHISGWKKTVPYHIGLKTSNLFCLPGIYSESQKSFVIITREGNEIMKQIHNGGDNPFRMPLFLPAKEVELRWLAKDLSDSEMAAILDYELPSEDLEYYTVDTIRTTKDRADGMPKNHPKIWPGLPPLGIDSIEQTLF
jgi:putative SOS response-associated peptidase YedK